jgi:hypothetical protein
LESLEAGRNGRVKAVARLIRLWDRGCGGTLPPTVERHEAVAETLVAVSHASRSGRIVGAIPPTASGDGTSEPRPGSRGDPRRHQQEPGLTTPATCPGLRQSWATQPLEDRHTCAVPKPREHHQLGRHFVTKCTLSKAALHALQESLRLML